MINPPSCFFFVSRFTVWVANSPTYMFLSNLCNTDEVASVVNLGKISLAKETTGLIIFFCLDYSSHYLTFYQKKSTWLNYFIQLSLAKYHICRYTVSKTICYFSFCLPVRNDSWDNYSSLKFFELFLMLLQSYFLLQILIYLVGFLLV